MKFNGLQANLATPRTITSPHELASTALVTMPTSANAIERVPTATRPATKTSGTGAGIVVSAGINYLKIIPLVSGSGTAYTMNVVGWAYSASAALWIPTPIVSQTITNAVTGTGSGSFTYPGTATVVFGALTITDPATSGMRTRYPGQGQGSSRFGFIVIDCLANELIELVFHSSAGGTSAGAIIADF